MSQIASDAKISSAMAALGMTAPLPNLDDSQVLKAILVALGNITGGSGGTGDVVGPASSTAGNAPVFASGTGKLLADSGVALTAAAIGFTIAGGTSSKTLTVLNTGTAALLEAVNVFTVNGAASTPAMWLSGGIFSGGSSGTTWPHFLIQPDGVVSTGWNTGGTLFGANAPSGFMGDLSTWRIDAVRKADITPTGLNLYGSSAVFRMYDSDGGYLRVLADNGIFQADEYRYKQGSVWGLSGNLDGNLKPGLGLGLNSTIQFASSGTYYDTPEFNLRRVATRDLSVIPVSGSQTFSIYGTSDTTNFERLAFITTAGAYSIKPEAGGTGTLRTLQISGLPTSNPGAGILWNNAGTPAIGT